MSNWIKIDANLSSNKKFFALCEQLQTKDHETMGGLVMFWSWCFENAKDGILTDIHVKSLGRALRGFDGKVWFRALVDCGFVDDDGDGNFFIHDWFDWAGSLHKNRKGNRERKQKERLHKEVTATSQGSPKMSQDRVEESRGEEIRIEDSSPSATPQGDKGQEKGSPQKPKRARTPRDDVFDFVVSHWNFDPKVHKGKVGKFSADFFALLKGAGIEEIKRRHENYIRSWPEMDRGPGALISNWPKFEHDISSNARPCDPVIKALQDRVNARLAAKNAQG